VGSDIYRAFLAAYSTSGSWDRFKNLTSSSRRLSSFRTVFQAVRSPVSRPSLLLSVLVS